MRLSNSNLILIRLVFTTEGIIRSRSRYYDRRNRFRYDSVMFQWKRIPLSYRSRSGRSKPNTFRVDENCDLFILVPLLSTWTTLRFFATPSPSSLWLRLPLRLLNFYLMVSALTTDSNSISFVTGENQSEKCIIIRILMVHIINRWQSSVQVGVVVRWPRHCCLDSSHSTHNTKGTCNVVVYDVLLF